MSRRVDRLHRNPLAAYVNILALLKRLIGEGNLLGILRRQMIGRPKFDGQLPPPRNVIRMQMGINRMLKHRPFVLQEALIYADHPVRINNCSFSPRENHVGEAALA
ncbi:hypothetical protein D3C78_1085540 [compost metagenome]